MNGTKPGYKTTEFWLDLATKAGVLWGAVQGFIPPKYAAIAAVTGTAIYTIARAVAKAMADIKQIAPKEQGGATVEVNTKVG